MKWGGLYFKGALHHFNFIIIDRLVRVPYYTSDSKLLAESFAFYFCVVKQRLGQRWSVDHPPFSNSSLPFSVPGIFQFPKRFLVVL